MFDPTRTAFHGIVNTLVPCVGLIVSEGRSPLRERQVAGQNHAAVLELRMARLKYSLSRPWGIGDFAARYQGVAHKTSVSSIG